jgi:hypothetical protein
MYLTSKHIPNLFQTHCLNTFTICSKHIPNFFQTHPQFVPNTLPLCSKHIVLNTFPICSKHIPTLFRTHSRFAPNTFPICSKHIPNFSKHIPNLFQTHSQLVPVMYKEIQLSTGVLLATISRHIYHQRWQIYGTMLYFENQHFNIFSLKILVIIQQR